MTRINVGCGQTPTQGWMNYDNSPSIYLAKYPLIVTLLSKIGLINVHQKRFITFIRKNQISWANVTKRIPLPSDTVEVVYTSHMLEHLDKREVTAFLSEAHRVLQKNGIIRIAVPDLRKLVDNYLTHADADKFISETYLAVPKATGWREKVKQFIVGNRHHHWMYDADSLVRLLETANFREATPMEAGQSMITNPHPLDLYERADASIYVEARK